jgi:TIR domain
MTASHILEQHDGRLLVRYASTRLTFRRAAIELLPPDGLLEIRVRPKAGSEFTVRMTRAEFEQDFPRVQQSRSWAAGVYSYPVLPKAVLRYVTHGTVTQPLSIEVFLSYSHRDEALRRVLEDHLALLRRQGVISTWHDRQIGAGTEWAGQIDKRLEKARVILLLVSAAFLASDYCNDVEVKRAMQRHETGEARVIPVILRPVDWHEASFGKLQALPRDGKPITTCSNRDQALLDVTRGIRTAVRILPSGPTIHASIATAAVTGCSTGGSSPSFS